MKKKKFLATALSLITTLSIIGCGKANVTTLNNSANENDAIAETENSSGSFDFSKVEEEMDFYVTCFKKMETEENEEPKYIVSVAIETTWDVINNTMVHLSATTHDHKDGEICEEENCEADVNYVSCAAYVEDTYYILTYGIVTGINSIDQCQYTVYNYNNSTENITFDLKENDTTPEPLASDLFNTDAGDFIFVEMRDYNWGNKENGNTEMSLWFLMQPITGYYEDLDLNDFSCFLTDDVSEEVLNNFTVKVTPFDYTSLDTLIEDENEEIEYFNDMYRALNITITFNEEALTETYGDKLDALIYECLKGIGIVYNGDTVRFEYVPAYDELIYE